MRQRKKRRLISEINVVPYIDVMLVLLVIFMITAPLLSQGVKVDLPQVPSKPMPPEDKEPVIISIDREGRFFSNYPQDSRDEPKDPQELATHIAALRKYQPKIPVYVKGDKDVEYGRVIELMAILQGAGIEGVGLVTEPLRKK